VVIDTVEDFEVEIEAAIDSDEQPVEETICDRLLVSDSVPLGDAVLVTVRLLVVALEKLASAVKTVGVVEIVATCVCDSVACTVTDGEAVATAVTTVTVAEGDRDEELIKVTEVVLDSDGEKGGLWRPDNETATDNDTQEDKDAVTVGVCDIDTDLDDMSDIDGEMMADTLTLGVLDVEAESVDTNTATSLQSHDKY